MSIKNHHKHTAKERNMRYILFQDTSGDPVIRKYYHSHGKSSANKDYYWMVATLNKAHIFDDIYEAIDVVKWVHEAWGNELSIKVLY